MTRCRGRRRERNCAAARDEVTRGCTEADPERNLKPVKGAIGVQARTVVTNVVQDEENTVSLLHLLLERKLFKKGMGS